MYRLLLQNHEVNGKKLIQLLKYTTNNALFQEFLHNLEEFLGPWVRKLTTDRTEDTDKDDTLIGVKKMRRLVTSKRAGRIFNHKVETNQRFEIE
jgi:hypothetical protein